MTASAREVMDSAMTEREWQAQVREYAEARLWICYHTHDSRRSDPGFPDLLMVRRTRVVAAELKRETGRVSQEQALWLDRLLGTGKVEVFVWRPSDWEKVQEALA